MKKLLIVCAVSLASLTFTGCGFTSTLSNNLSETKVVLSEKNFKVVGQAYGEAKSTYVFGLGGIRKKALKNNAINEMSKNAKLTGAQTLTNVTVQTSMKMITPIYVQLTCTATANIIEFE